MPAELSHLCHCSCLQNGANVYVWLVPGQYTFLWFYVQCLHLHCAVTPKTIFNLCDPAPAWLDWAKFHPHVVGGTNKNLWLVLASSTPLKRGKWDIDDDNGLSSNLPLSNGTIYRFPWCAIIKIWRVEVEGVYISGQLCVHVGTCWLWHHFTNVVISW